MTLEDDVRLVARTIGGDSNAFEELIARYRPLIYAILLRHINLSRDDADEVFQRFLIHIWEDDFRRLHSWSRKAVLAAYLGTIARNLARDFQRERRVESLAPPAYTPRHQTELEETVRTALAELSPRDRDLIRRRFYLGQTYREIAEQLGMTVSHTGVALSRAEFRLKQILIRKQT
jgi:RNA polymerase sigma factor (sigma-70 family)